MLANSPCWLCFVTTDTTSVLVLGTDDHQPSEFTTCIPRRFLKDYLQTKLDNAWVACTHHLAEMDRIEQESRADVVEVGVI